MKAFPKFDYQGSEYDLTHLTAFSCDYIQPAKSDGTAEKRYRCIIEFSSHCFTRGENKRKGEKLSDVEPALHYVTAKETRIFCFERYQVSKMLPQIMREISRSKCYFTSADDKFLTISVTDKNGKKVDYEIYFSLQRAKSPKHDVHIYINSAYIRDKDYKENHGTTVRKKPVGFFVLLHNTLVNKRIKRPK